MSSGPSACWENMDCVFLAGRDPYSRNPTHAKPQEGTVCHDSISSKHETLLTLSITEHWRVCNSMFRCGGRHQAIHRGGAVAGGRSGYPGANRPRNDHAPWPPGPV